MYVFVKAVIVVEQGSFDHRPMRGASTIPALEPVANRPIIHHVIDGFRAAPPIGLVIAGEADALTAVRKSLGDDEHGIDGLEYAICEPRLEMAATLRSVAPLVGDSPCVLQPGDGLLGEPVASLLHSLTHGSPDLVLHAADLTTTVGYDGTRALGSPRNGSSRNGSPDAEVAVFGAGGLQRAIDVVGPAESADLALIAERLTAAGGTVRFQLSEGWRRYDGNGSDLLELNRLALDGIVGNVRPSLRRENQIEGRVFIHPTASARTSVIIGPTVIGPGACVENAYIGAYTSVGAGARIEGAEIERSIISPGASVVHVGGRLVSSLVGRNARVFRDFSLPRAMRLWVGEGGEVALC
jgi:glucose-1-phosphate thymidylyltransferase